MKQRQIQCARESQLDSQIDSLRNENLTYSEFRNHSLLQ